MLGLRRHLTFANITSVTAIVIAMSMGTAYAGGLIGSSDIKRNAIKARHIKAGAVTSPKIGAGAVTGAKIAPSTITRDKLAANARTNVIRYNLGTHDFTGSSSICAHLTGLGTADRLNSMWTGELDNSSAGASSTVPGDNFSGNYGVFIYDAIGGIDACVELNSGTGASFAHVYIFRTILTSGSTPSSSRVAPGHRSAG